MAMAAALGGQAVKSSGRVPGDGDDFQGIAHGKLLFCLVFVA